MAWNIFYIGLLVGFCYGYEITEHELEFEDFPYFRVALSCNLTDLFPQINHAINTGILASNPEKETACQCSCDFNYDELSTWFSGIWTSTLVFSIIPSAGVVGGVLWVVWNKFANGGDGPSVNVRCLNCENKNTTEVIDTDAINATDEN